MRERFSAFLLSVKNDWQSQMRLCRRILLPLEFVSKDDAAGKHWNLTSVTLFGAFFGAVYMIGMFSMLGYLTLHMASIITLAASISATACAALLGGVAFLLNAAMTAEQPEPRQAIYDQP